MSFKVRGEKYRLKYWFPLSGGFDAEDWLALDLSRDNPELTDAVIADRESLEDYIFGKIREAGARGAYGGYGEDRGIYRKSGVFTSGETWRSLHLGVDFWAEAGTEVCAVLPGKVHSFADNSSSGDYGPTIILRHDVGNETVYSLYGHLSRASLVGTEPGQTVHGNEVIGTLGTPDENVDWPPHLHFQLIKDLGDRKGDYPGVCMPDEADEFLKNSPDPMSYFGTFGE